MGKHIAIVTIILTAWCYLVFLPAATAADPAKQKLAIMDLRVDTDLPKGMDKTLNEILLGEFHRHGGFDVLGRSDIVSMLQMEEQKTMLSGCTDDSCLVEIGGALGVAWMVTPSIGAVGERYVVNLKLIDVSAGRVLSRVNEFIDRDQDALVAGMNKAVKNLMAAMNVSQKTAPQAKAESTQIAPWVTLGLGVAAAGAGGVLGGLALKDDAAAQDEVQGSAAWRSHSDSASDKALAADVLFGVAGAAALTTLILFLLPDDEASDDSGPSASLTPATAGSGAALGISF